MKATRMIIRNAVFSLITDHTKHSVNGKVFAEMVITDADLFDRSETELIETATELTKQFI